MLDGLPIDHFGVACIDPAWQYATRGRATSRPKHYRTMPTHEIISHPVWRHMKPDSVLLIWAIWPMLLDALKVGDAYGFTYKTCAQDWMKADVSSVDMFDAPKQGDMGMGYWGRHCSEPLLLFTRGQPKRKSAGVRTGLIEPAREHSRKPDEIYKRITKLCHGPFLEMNARTERPGWTCVGDEVGKFK